MEVRGRFQALARGARAALTLLRTRRGAAIAITALLVTHAALNLLWLRLDQHVIRIDEEFHVSAAQDYFYALADPAISGLKARWEQILAIESPYPPMLHVLGAFFALLLGYSFDTIALTGTLCFLLVVWGTYRIARTVYARPAAVLAAAITSLIPILYGGSRYVALENLIAACSVWAVYFLLVSGNFRRTRYVVLFAIVNGMAILTKPNAFVYYLLPAAMVFALGLREALRARAPRECARLAAHALVCLAITGAIAAPWYLYHRADLEQYWMSEHKGGKTPFTFTESEAPAAAGPVRLLEDRVTNPAERLPRAMAAQPAAATAPPAPPAEPASAAETAPAAPPWQVRLSDTLLGREWLAYPILIINNALFLPLVLLSVAGLGVAAWRFRRSPAFWLIFLWLFGSYFLNTALFRYINPRYTMPFIAVFGICVAGLPHALHGRRWRAVFAAVLLAALALQYLNISFLDLSRFNLWLPAAKDHFRVKYFFDEGLAITKSEVITGTYCFRAPARGENYVQRGFRAMARCERELGHASGRTVKYISMARQNNFGGFKLAEPSYWPAPNPLLFPELEDKPELHYRFTRIQRCNVAAEATGTVAEADYIVAILDQNEATSSVGPGHSYFDEIRALAPLALVDFYSTPAYGKLPPAMIAVFAKSVLSPFDRLEDYRGREAATPQRDLAVNAARLLALRESVGLPGGITPEEAVECEARLNALLPHLQSSANLSPNLDLVTIVLDQRFEGWFRLRLLFKVIAPPRHDWRIFVHALFDPADAHRFPESAQQQRFYALNFDPPRPTTQWQAGEFILCTREFFCPPVKLRNLSIGFFRNDNEPWGQSINTGPIDMGNDIPVNESPLLRF